VLAASGLERLSSAGRLRALIGTSATAPSPAAAACSSMSVSRHR